LDFSKFKKNNHEYITENVIQNEFCEKINEKNNIDIFFEKKYKDDIIEDIHHNFEFKKLNTLLMDEIEDLKIENDNLLNQISNLEKENNRQIFIIKNTNKYEEIFNNMMILNTRVTDEFLQNNYSEYIIY